MQKHWFPTFKLKVTAWVHMIMTVSTISSELLILLLSNLVLIVNYHKPVCLRMKYDCCLFGLRLFTPGSVSRK